MSLSTTRGRLLRERIWRRSYDLALILIVLGLLVTGAARRLVPPPHCDLLAMELADDREHWLAAFETCRSSLVPAVSSADGAITPSAPSNVAADAPRLPPAIARGLYADTFLLVPGYTLALVLIAIAALSRTRARWRHLVSVLPVGAGLFDWLENGLLFLAGNDAAAGRVSEALLADLVAAAAIKWGLLGASAGLLAGVLMLQRRVQGRGARIIAALLAAAAIAVLLGLTWQRRLLVLAVIGIGLAVLLGRGALSTLRPERPT